MQLLVMSKSISKAFLCNCIAGEFSPMPGSARTAAFACSEP